MSIRLPIVDLTGATVGKSGTVSWASVQRTPTQAQRNAGDNGTIVIRNESGCGLALAFDASESTTYLSAGEWSQIGLQLTDTQFTWTVDYALNNPSVSRLVVVYFQPGQPVDSPGFLGNSPVGIGGSVPTAVTQVIQDGQAIGLVIVESTPTGLIQTILFDTSPKLTLNAGAGVSDKTLFEFKSSLLQDWLLIYRTSGNLAFFENSSGVTSLGLSAGNGLANIGGQGTVGKLGVPVIVAQAISVLVTTTAGGTILSYTPGASGLYRISVYVLLNNGTSGQLVSSIVNWTDVDSGLATSTPTVALIPGGAVTAFSGSNSVVNGDYAMFAITVNAKAANAITITYHDPANTPNDRVSVLIERIS